MCGRTACTLAPDDICRATNHRSRDGKHRKPVWKDAPGGKKYYPSHNIAPGSHTPVMLSSQHYPPGEFSEDVERVIQPMKWGLVPSWHKGDPYKLEYETNNCRAESMLIKRTYKIPLEKGRRCVILADGFFEWKRTKESKQPYFIYFPENQTSNDKKDDLKTEIIPENESAAVKIEQPEFIKEKSCTDIKNDLVKQETNLDNQKKINRDNPVSVKQEPINLDNQEAGNHDNLVQVKVENCETSKQSTSCSNIKTEINALKIESKINPDTEIMEEWKGQKLLTIAGVFEVWKPPDGSEELYSYSIITVDSSPAMAWIHHRMPAVLSSDEEIDEWLDFGSIPLSKASKLIRPTECITMHPVSTTVNNSRNKSPDCIVKIDPQKPKKTASSSFMMSWLGKGKQHKDDEKEPPSKKFKAQ